METIVTPLAAGTEYTLVRVRILTGRTHQIRLHLSEAGHPILGDPKYGDPKKNAKAKEKYGVRGQLLHCAAMRFHDGPLAGKTVECPPPDTFTRIQKALFKEKATGNEGRKKTDR
jgi:23S rRNA pseudouridine955/2504/2580 synthase